MSPFCWVYILFIGFFTQLGQFFLTFGYKILPAGKAASSSYTQVPLSIVAGIVLFNDSISIYFFIGSFIIFFALFLIIRDKYDSQIEFS